MKVHCVLENTLTYLKIQEIWQYLNDKGTNGALLEMSTFSSFLFFSIFQKNRVGIDNYKIGQNKIFLDGKV